MPLWFSLFSLTPFLFVLVSAAKSLIQSPPPSQRRTQSPRRNRSDRNTYAHLPSHSRSLSPSQTRPHIPTLHLPPSPPPHQAAVINNAVLKARKRVKAYNRKARSLSLDSTDRRKIDLSELDPYDTNSPPPQQYQRDRKRNYMSSTMVLPKPKPLILSPNPLAPSIKTQTSSPRTLSSSISPVPKNKNRTSLRVPSVHDIHDIIDQLPPAHTSPDIVKGSDHFEDNYLLHNVDNEDPVIPEERRGRSLHRKSKPSAKKIPPRLQHLQPSSSPVSTSHKSSPIRKQDSISPETVFRNHSTLNRVAAGGSVSASPRGTPRYDIHILSTRTRSRHNSFSFEDISPSGAPASYAVSGNGAGHSRVRRQSVDSCPPLPPSVALSSQTPPAPPPKSATKPSPTVPKGSKKHPLPLAVPGSPERRRSSQGQRQAVPIDLFDAEPTDAAAVFEQGKPHCGDGNSTANHALDTAPDGAAANGHGSTNGYGTDGDNSSYHQSNRSIYNIIQDEYQKANPANDISEAINGLSNGYISPYGQSRSGSKRGSGTKRTGDMPHPYTRSQGGRPRKESPNSRIAKVGKSPTPSYFEEYQQQQQQKQHITRSPVHTMEDSSQRPDYVYHGPNVRHIGRESGKIVQTKRNGVNSYRRSYDSLESDSDDGFGIRRFQQQQQQRRRSQQEQEQQQKEHQQQQANVRHSISGGRPSTLRGGKNTSFERNCKTPDSYKLYRRSLSAIEGNSRNLYLSNNKSTMLQQSAVKRLSSGGSSGGSISAGVGYKHRNKPMSKAQYQLIFGHLEDVKHAKSPHWPRSVRGK